MELCNFLLITDLPQSLCCWPSSVVGIQFISSDCSAPDNLELSKNCKPDRSNWERQEDAGLQQQDGRSEGGLFYRLHMGGNIVFPLFHCFVLCNYEISVFPEHFSSLDKQVTSVFRTTVWMGFAPVECLHESSFPNKEKQPLCFALIDSFPAHKIPLMMNRRHWRNAIQPSTALFLPRHDNVVSPCIDGWTFWLRFAQSLRLLSESVQRNWIVPHHSKRAVLGYITQSTAIGNAPRTEPTTLSTDGRAIETEQFDW